MNANFQSEPEAASSSMAQQPAPPASTALQQARVFGIFDRTTKMQQSVSQQLMNQELFDSLPDAALWRYQLRNQLPLSPAACTRSQLAETCAAHFAQQPQQRAAMNQQSGDMNEKEVLPWFIYRVRNRGTYVLPVTVVSCVAMKSLNEFFD